MRGRGSRGCVEDDAVAINHRALAAAIDHLIDVHVPGERPLKLLLVSPHQRDWEFLRVKFPGATLRISTRAHWDLSKPFSAAFHFDIVVASNVFHYASAPEVWFDNVLEHTDYLVLQDLVSRRRAGKYPHLGADGDAMRYCFSRRQVTSDFPGAFDLNRIEDRILWFQAYAGGRNELHPSPSPAPQHFAAIVRGASRYKDVRDEGYRGFKYESMLLEYRVLGFPIRIARKLRRRLSFGR